MVGQTFCHGTYDRVYASKEERVGGGGSLINYFADWAGMERDQFSEFWDVGHRLQLIYIYRCIEKQ